MAVGTKILNAFVAYEFIKLLSTPFKKTKAFELGIIDDEGKVLKKRRNLTTSDEKKAYTIFHTLVWNIKKLLAKVGIGKSTIASLAAALYLIKEECEGKDLNYKSIELALMNHLHDISIDLVEETDDIETLPAGDYILSTSLTLDDGTTVRPGDDVFVVTPQKPIANILGINLFTVTHKMSGKELPISYKDLKAT
jgi:hypothetical protein